jgi:hypothetical protein
MPAMTSSGCAAVSSLYRYRLLSRALFARYDLTVDREGVTDVSQIASSGDEAGIETGG